MAQLALSTDKERPEISRQFNSEKKMSVIQDDALKACKKLPDEIFSLIISSPPYNIGKTYEKKINFESYLDDQRTVIAELVRTLRYDGSLCWQVGNYIDKGEVYPLDIYFYPVFKSLGLHLETESYGILGMVCMRRNDFPVGMKRYSGSPKVTITFSIWIPFAFHLNILAKDIIRETKKVCRVVIHWVKTLRIFGIYYKRSSTNAFGISQMSRQIIQKKYLNIPVNFPLNW